jgi:histidinol-phosphate phosphatase family protein
MQSINREWTLFLDRDGVINVEKEDDYIRNENEFIFLDQVPEAIPLFNSIFSKIFIVTNQKGVGKGLMSETDLQGIHHKMLSMISQAGGSIDKVYFCTAIDPLHPCRKPNPGMAYQAKLEYPSIDLQRSLMIGNTMGDMKFGKACGMLTVFLPSGKPELNIDDPMVDAVYPNLMAVAKALQIHAGTT